MMGVAGLLALVFVGWMMVQTIKDSDTNANAGQQQTVKQPSAAPDKTPPLNK
jgi:hypothetical protein